MDSKTFRSLYFSGAQWVDLPEGALLVSIAFFDVASNLELALASFFDRDEPGCLVTVAELDPEVRLIRILFFWF